MYQQPYSFIVETAVESRGNGPIHNMGPKRCSQSRPRVSHKVDVTSRERSSRTVTGINFEPDSGLLQTRAQTPVPCTKQISYQFLFSQPSRNSSRCIENYRRSKSYRDIERSFERVYEFMKLFMRVLSERRATSRNASEISNQLEADQLADLDIPNYSSYYSVYSAASLRSQIVQLAVRIGQIFLFTSCTSSTMLQDYRRRNGRRKCCCCCAQIAAQMFLRAFLRCASCCAL